MIILWVVVGVAWWRITSRSKRKARDTRLLCEGISEVTDMLSVLLLSGLSTPQALQQVYLYTDPPLHDHLRDSAQLLTNGARLRDVVHQLRTSLGTHASYLCEALLASERDGLAIGPMLDRLSSISRMQRRQQHDSDARQLPIKMALPLVGCVLPSFVLLGIIPLFAGTFIGLGAHISA
jgi:Flp pilus assembly protein TadB